MEALCCRGLGRVRTRAAEFWKPGSPSRVLPGAPGWDGALPSWTTGMQLGRAPSQRGGGWTGHGSEAVESRFGDGLQWDWKVREESKMAFVLLGSRGHVQVPTSVCVSQQETVGAATLLICQHGRRWSPIL